MVASKHITKFAAAVMAAAIAICFLAMIFREDLETALNGTSVSMEYVSELFHTDKIIQIDIRMEEKDWDEMLANAIAEEYSVCDVNINGQDFYSVAIRPKGNTSLSAIAMDDTTDRYSLKLEFDHYVEGQTCYGLDKLILNNNYADATNMKEAIVYDMYQYLGTDASLYNYAQISLNGEYWGVYLALEAVEDSFLLRNYGTQDGNLYKPDSMNMGGKFDGKDFEPSKRPDSKPSDLDREGQKMPEGQAPVDGGFAGRPKQMGAHPGGKNPMGGNGANLNYSDDELDSYSDIWEGEVVKTSKSDHRRVITALKNVSQGTELETYLDIDNVLKYMAVHTFSVNMDSLSGNIAHNYYLYEYGGRLNILPWDYNLAFGGMSMGEEKSASEMVNDAIDTPFGGTQFFDALLENEAYAKRYHGYLQQLADEYVSGGIFDKVYGRIRSQIDGLVRTDPTAFYSFDEYDAGANMLYQAVLLRAESIRGQIDGSIPSTDEGQRIDSANLVDASQIDIDTMGVFNMGGRSFQFNGVDVRFPDQNGESASGGNKEPADKQIEAPKAPYGRQTAFVSYAVSFLTMLFALFAVKAYRRKKRRLI